MALFDSDILIDHLRYIAGAKTALLKFADESNAISVLTAGEILFGMREEEKDRTMDLLARFIAIPVDQNMVNLAYDIKSKAIGHKLELYDCIIAATSILQGQTLVTRNARHYPDKRLRIFIPKY
jgi:predicted nucleic acid-binding protein